MTTTLLIVAAAALAVSVALLTAVLAVVSSNAALQREREADNGRWKEVAERCVTEMFAARNPDIEHARIQLERERVALDTAKHESSERLRRSRGPNVVGPRTYNNGTDAPASDNTGEMFARSAILDATDEMD